jgi:hypothetical protein
MSSFNAHAVASCIKNTNNNTNDDEKFGSEFFHFLRLPSVFPASGTWFFSKLPGSITGKKLSIQLGSIIFDQKHHMTEFIAPVAVNDDHAHWINTTIETINEANTSLIFSCSVRDNSDSSSDNNEENNNNSKNNNVITPDCNEKFQYLGQTDINHIITVASFPMTDGDWSLPCLVCIGFPTTPRGGLTVKANDLWTASNENEEAPILKPGNIKGPTPFSSPMFTFKNFSNTRGKKDLSPEDAPPPFSPSSLLGILTNDSIL